MDGPREVVNYCCTVVTTLKEEVKSHNPKLFGTKVGEKWTGEAVGCLGLDVSLATSSDRVSCNGNLRNDQGPPEVLLEQRVDLKHVCPLLSCTSSQWRHGTA